jgi:hypothetical protein
VALGLCKVTGMSDPIDDDIYKSTFRLLLSHAKDEYDEHSSIWRDLDRKAQGNIAICGIFMAGVTVIFRVVFDPDVFTKALLTASFIFPAVAAFLSIKVMQVVEVQAIEGASDIAKASKEIFDCDENNKAKEKLRLFVTTRIEAWVSVTEDVAKANKEKAHFLAMAQSLLRAGVFSSGFLLCYVLWLSN